jgi:hypothetical protein
MPTAHRPRLLVTFSLVAFLVVALIGIIAALDQHQRIKDPDGYADRRCKAAFVNETFTPAQFSRCVENERSKSTLASIYPLFVTGVVVGILGISGLFVGRAQTRKGDNLTKKLKGL